jgi:hypothetical protein
VCVWDCHEEGRDRDEVPRSRQTTDAKLLPELTVFQEIFQHRVIWGLKREHSIPSFQELAT